MNKTQTLIKTLRTLSIGTEPEERVNSIIAEAADRLEELSYPINVKAVMTNSYDPREAWMVMLGGLNLGTYASEDAAVSRVNQVNASLRIKS